MTRFRPLHRLAPRYTSFTLIAGFLSACSSTAPNHGSQHHLRKQTVSGPSSQALMPEYLADPFEPVNRGVWEVNKGLLLGVIQPVGRGYRRVVPPPARTSIGNFTRNITYPGRVLNHALQGRWAGAGDETKRFAYNTTVGVVGLFDVASKWDVPKSDANFSQTFGTWGWRPHAFLMLPLLGPSDDRNLVGRAADSAAEPWSYDEPYVYGSYVSAVNQTASRSEDAARLVRAEGDSYALTKYAWSYANKDGKPDMQPKGAPDISTLETLGAAKMKYQDPEFQTRAKEMSVRIPSTGKKLKFNYWLQKETAPLVYVSPGLSSHRLSMTCLVLAEHLYQNGFSVVTTSSAFHPEFMENASTAELPGYPPIDSMDLLVALTEMDRALTDRYPDRFGKRALVGCSMGAFLTMNIAARENEQHPELLRFARHVAIDLPVDLQHGATTLDEFYSAPLAWPAAERQARIDNSLHKVAVIANVTEDTPPSAPPFEAAESKYLIGLTFRLSLRDILYSTQTRNDRGVIQAPLSRWRREEAYQEMMRYTFKDYFEKFAGPYYQEKGISFNQLRRQGNLRIHQKRFSNRSDIRILVNQNDFLLPSRDQAWLNSTFGPSRVTIFPNGGHLGNLTTPPVKKAILNSLGGLH